MARLQEEQHWYTSWHPALDTGCPQQVNWLSHPSESTDLPQQLHVEMTFVTEPPPRRDIAGPITGITEPARIPVATPVARPAPSTLPFPPSLCSDDSTFPTWTSLGSETACFKMAVKGWNGSGCAGCTSSFSIWQLRGSNLESHSTPQSTHLLLRNTTWGEENVFKCCC